MNFLMVFLSIAGLWISIYFTGVYYKWFSPHVRWVPQICRLDENSCLSVLQTPRAKIFGVPNSAFGIATYSYLLFASHFFPPILGWVLLALALARSVYLAYSLIFVTKIPCPLCFASHAINLSLFVIFIYKIFH